MMKPFPHLFIPEELDRRKAFILSLKRPLTAFG